MYSNLRTYQHSRSLPISICMITYASSLSEPYPHRRSRLDEGPVAVVTTSTGTESLPFTSDDTASMAFTFLTMLEDSSPEVAIFRFTAVW